MQDVERTPDIRTPTGDSGAGKPVEGMAGLERGNAALVSLAETFGTQAEALARAAQALSVDAGVLESAFVFDDDLVARIQARIEEAFLPTQELVERIQSRIGGAQGGGGTESKSRIIGPRKEVSVTLSQVRSKSVASEIGVYGYGFSGDSKINKNHGVSETVNYETMTVYFKYLDELRDAGFGSETYREVLGAQQILSESGLPAERNEEVLGAIVKASILGLKGEFSSYEGGRYNFLAHAGQDSSPVRIIENLAKVYRNEDTGSPFRRDIENLLKLTPDQAEVLLGNMTSNARFKAARMGYAMADFMVIRYLEKRASSEVWMSSEELEERRKKDRDLVLCEAVARRAYQYEQYRTEGGAHFSEAGFGFFLEGQSKYVVEKINFLLSSFEEKAKAPRLFGFGKPLDEPDPEAMEPLRKILEEAGVPGPYPFSDKERGHENPYPSILPPSHVVPGVSEPSGGTGNRGEQEPSKGEESGFFLPGNGIPDTPVFGGIPGLSLPQYALGLPDLESVARILAPSIGPETHNHNTDVVINVSVNTPDAGDGHRIGRDIAETLKNDYTHLLDVSNTPLRIA